MPLTTPQALRAAEGLIEALHANGVANIPFTKPVAKQLLDALLVALESTAYRNAQSSAIDSVLPGLTAGQKKILHRAALRAMLDEDLI